jgi:hypothetical protein
MKSYLGKFMVTTVTWLTATNSCVTNDHEYAMFVVHDYRRVGNKRNTMGAKYWTGTAYPCEQHDCSSLVLWRVYVAPSFVVCVIVCSFSFGHYIVPPSSSYCCGIPLCYLQSFHTSILLVIDVMQFLNYPAFSMHFSDLTLLFGMLIIILF